MNEDYVLMGKHLTEPKTEWMVYRGTEKGAGKAIDTRRNEPNFSKMEYTIMSFKKYMEGRK